MQRSLAMELSQLSMAFRKQQKAYLSKVKQAKEGSTSPDPFVQQGKDRKGVALYPTSPDFLQL